MFYSQVILAKKGPLGTVWQAAHWGDKKLGRSAIFNTDISATVSHLTNESSAVPMALRVSGHLLLGVVRIYSRQVQFLRDDCHQAMIKVKMAYSSAGGNAAGNGTIDIAVIATTRGSNGNSGNNGNSGGPNSKQALNVSNFGEFQDGLITDYNFGNALDGIYLHNDEDWLPAELDTTVSPIRAANGDASMNDSTEKSLPSGGGADQSFGNDTEEWGVFDPEDDDDKTEEGNIDANEEMNEDSTDKTKAAQASNERDDEEGSYVSEVEKTRAADVSGISDNTSIRRSIGMADNSVKDGEGNVTDADYSVGMGEDPFADDQDVMMDDDDDNSAERRRRQSLRLSFSNEDGSRVSDVANISFGDHSDRSTTGVTNAPVSPTDTVEAAPPSKKRKSNATKNNRKKRRRRVEMDDGHSELSNDFIKHHMLQDTSDVVEETIHPATWAPGSVAKDSSESDTLLLFGYLSTEDLICRPTSADNGQVAGELLALWTRNCAPVHNLPFEYELQDEAESNVMADADAADKTAAPNHDDDESDESVEQMRGANDKTDDTVHSHEGLPAEKDDHEPPEDMFDDDMPVPDMDDNDRVPLDDEAEDYPVPSSPMGGSDHSVQSIFSLGATNGLDDVDFATEADGEQDATTTTSKWHKNTLKVFDILKQSLAPTDGSEKKDVVSYNELTEGVSRRTAAGLFFELLLLKTLNYIELEQEESYGDILVKEGAKFMEDLPSS